jgi:hypothetical protein
MITLTQAEMATIIVIILVVWGLIVGSVGFNIGVEIGFRHLRRKLRERVKNIQGLDIRRVQEFHPLSLDSPLSPEDRELLLKAQPALQTITALLEELKP